MSTRYKLGEGWSPEEDNQDEIKTLAELLLREFLDNLQVNHRGH